MDLPWRDKSRVVCGVAVRNIYRCLDADHREIQVLLDQLELAPADAPFDHVARRYLVDHLIMAASRHEAGEELVFWPAVRKRARDGAALADAGLAQEREAKFVLDAMRFSRSDDGLVDEARELAELVRAHIDFEEQQTWPALKQTTTRLGAVVLGAKFALATKFPPTRPHPGGPNTPLGFATRGVPAVILDHARDRLSGRHKPHPDLSTIAAGPDTAAVVSRDHAAIESLLRRLDNPGDPDSGLVNQLVKQFSIHDAIERKHLYPAMRRRLADGNDRYAQWIRQHVQVATLLAEIDRRPHGDPHRRDLLNELIPLVRFHIADEESALVVVQTRMAPEELVALGRALDSAKARAPTRPHAHIAGAGPGARLSWKLLTPLDRIRDAISHRS